MTADTETYRKALIFALRMKDVPAARIGELVAEVESHVAETGEDPVEAFGTAKEYAASLTAEHRRPPRWQVVLIALAAGVAGWLLAQGLFAWLLAERYLGQPGWLWVAVGGVIAVPTARYARDRSGQVRDPRTGRSLTPSPRWVPVALLVLAVVPALAAYLVLRFAG